MSTKLRNLLSKVPWVSRVPECLSDFWVPECPSVQVPCMCKCPSALWMSNFHLSTLRVKQVLNITKNGLANGFIEFLKTLQNTYFYITLIVSSFLGNKMYKFYHILVAKCNHSNGFQKPAFQKTKYDRVRSSLLIKIVVLHLQCTVLLLQL